MARKPKQPQKTGRKPAEVDLAALTELAKIQCTFREIAAVLKVSTKTLQRRFVHHIKEARKEGRASLRRTQFKLAEKGNPALCIWLGKQHLGQSDKAFERHEVTGKGGGPVKYQSIDPKRLSDDELRAIRDIQRRHNEPAPN